LPYGRIYYTYDENGNQVKEVHTVGSDTTKIGNFTYDYENRLIKIVYPYIPDEEEPPISPLGMSTLLLPPGPIPADDVYKFVYDAYGLRVKKIHNGTTIYIYDEWGNVIQELDGKGNIRASYIYANGMRIAKIKADGSVVYYHSDVLGSPVLLMNEAGSVVKLYHFGPFGNLEAQWGTEPNHYLFTGKERDENGLYYFYARYYNPRIGRFITPDSFTGYLELPRSQHPYAYCYNNPVNYIDPWGLRVRYLGSYVDENGILTFVIEVIPDPLTVGEEVQRYLDEFWSAEHGSLFELPLTRAEIPLEPPPEQPQNELNEEKHEVEEKAIEQSEQEGFSGKAALKAALAHFYFPVALLSNIISPIGLPMDAGTALAGYAEVFYFQGGLIILAGFLPTPLNAGTITVGIVFGGGIMYAGWRWGTRLTYYWYKTHPDRWPWIDRP